MAEQHTLSQSLFRKAAMERAIPSATGPMEPTTTDSITASAATSYLRSRLLLKAFPSRERKSPCSPNPG